MGSLRVAIVFVHGIFSSPKTWSRLEQVMDSDPDMVAFDRFHFTYWTPRMRINPLRRIPDFNTVADSLQTYLDNDVSDYQRVVLVSHSQGGLIVQRLLARMLHRGRGRRLRRIGRIIMFACPNSGSQLFNIARRGSWFWRHPHERELRPLNDLVTETQQLILERIVYTSTRTDDRCHIPIIACAGESDGIVTPASAKGVFPSTEVVPGDHFTIIRPDSVTHRSYTLLKNALLDFQSSIAPAAPRRQTMDWAQRALIDQHLLFGIERTVDEVGGWLGNRDGDRIISIFGAGGAGKTTIAYETVKKHATTAGFARIAWVSAKSSHLGASGKVEQDERTRYYWGELLAEISGQLFPGLDPVPALVEERFMQEIRKLDEAELCLIVVDNLETVPDAEKAILYFDREFKSVRHKVLLTTRHSLLNYSDRIRQLEWNRLSDEAAHDFAAYLGRDDPALDLTRADLENVVDASQGNPLIIKIIMRLCIDRKQSVGEIISKVRDRSHGIGESLATYLYDESLTALQRRVGEANAARLMNVFCGLPSGETIDVDEFHVLSGISSREGFDEAKAAASRLALIISSRGNTRFSVHSLLRAFVCGR
ncbi:alpha/beta fold hydrolase [Nonomuraea basaltis]|uniref:alpha/beta fold hydrolase n=1 Tax=Nonomuraea basaltis TaxID=2495887 RepID=UPI00110C6E51|nr:alpha/beta fold hydrolase [Nonomuraea basaltis]TMR90790.1 alpha/beta fold hydrolase [Nonomuraea basaltis]